MKNKINIIAANSEDSVSKAAIGHDLQLTTSITDPRKLCPKHSSQCYPIIPFSVFQ